MKRRKTADELASNMAEEMLGGVDPNGGLSKEGKSIVKSDDSKEDPDDDDDEEDEEEEDDGGEDNTTGNTTDDSNAEKSDLTSDDLMKALSILDGVSSGYAEGEVDRRAELAERIADGTITKSEREELYVLLSDDDDDDFGKSFSDVFAEDEQLATDYDVAPFIERNSQLVAEALDAMRETIAKSTGEQAVFNRALAKSFRTLGDAVAEQGEMIKSLSEANNALSSRVESVERTPLARKSAPSVGAIKKSFAGGGDTLSKGAILAGLNSIMKKSADNGFLAPCGEPVDRAIAMFESSGDISRALYEDVRNEVQGRN